MAFLEFVFLFALIISVCIVLYALITEKKGKVINWVINKKSSTQIINNAKLSEKQKNCTKGGILKNTDLVIVWAQNFLDHDVFYDLIKQNLEDGIRYFYILDRNHADSFKILLGKLFDDFEDERIVNGGIDVVFIKTALTLNNYVIMATGSEREEFYSAMIYDKRAFGWIKQSSYRAKLFNLRIWDLIKAVAKAQAESSKGDDNGFFYLSDQIMDYGPALPLMEEIERTMGPYSLPIGRLLEKTQLDEKSHNKVISLSERTKSHVLS